MPLEIRFHGTVDEVLADMQAYRGRTPLAKDTSSLPTVGAAAAPSVDMGVTSPVAAEGGGAAPNDGKKSGRKKAPAAETVIEQAPASDEPMLTIDEARERVRGFNSAGHMDEGFKALAEFNAKKLSEVDPDAAASGKPSAKYAKLVARIEQLIAAKPATETAA